MVRNGMVWYCYSYTAHYCYSYTAHYTVTYKWMLCCDVLWRGRVGSGEVGSKVMLHLFMFVFLFQAKVLICVNVLLAQSPSLW